MMDDVDERCDKFFEVMLKYSRYYAEEQNGGFDGKPVLRDLLGFTGIIHLALRHRDGVKKCLEYLWGIHGTTAVQEILDNPNPSATHLMILTDLLHDHVHYSIDIAPVMEAVSYALGNDNLFGDEFRDSRLRDAVAQRA